MCDCVAVCLCLSVSVFSHWDSSKIVKMCAHNFIRYDVDTERNDRKKRKRKRQREKTPIRCIQNTKYVLSWGSFYSLRWFSTQQKKIEEEKNRKRKELSKIIVTIIIIIIVIIIKRKTIHGNRRWMNISTKKVLCAYYTHTLIQWTYNSSKGNEEKQKGK